MKIFKKLLGKINKSFHRLNASDGEIVDAKQNNSKVTFHAYSDAIMTKGIIALLIKVFSNQSPDDIINSKLDFIDKIGLKSHLSATRANGLMSMIKQIKIYAIGFKEKNG